MGHRCNYAIRERGEVTVYYSHWGALSVVSDFFWGLEAAREFLEEQEPTEDGWLDEVDGEAGAALDLDEKVLTLSGGEISGEARALAFELASTIWARDGFTVRDVPTIVEVAQAVGVPRDRVEAEHFECPSLDLADDHHTGRADARFSVVVMIDGVPRFAGFEDSVLEIGAAQVAELERLPDLDEALSLCATVPLASWEKTRPTLGERVSDVIVIDTRQKRVEATLRHLRSGKTRAHFAAKWPGWEIVRRSRDEARRTLSVPALVPPPAPPPPSLEDQLGQVEQYLFGRSTNDIGKWFRDLTEKTTLEGGWVNPLALAPTFDGRPEDSAEADEIFRAAVAQVVATRHT